jgi:hypothetical protein
MRLSPVTVTVHSVSRWQRAQVYLGLCERYQELYQAQVAELHLLMATAPGCSLPLSHRRPPTDPSPTRSRRENVVTPWCNRRMLETPEEIDRLQQLLDRSAAGAGPHLLGIITDERRLSAAQVIERLPGMRLLAVATVTADGRPLAGPVDGYFLHGSFYFSSGRNSVRMRHLAARPAVSATYLPGEELAVTVHGRAELFDLRDPAHAELRQAMLDYYLPRQGPVYETWLDQLDAVGARIAAEKMFTFSAQN